MEDILLIASYLMVLKIDFHTMLIDHTSFRLENLANQKIGRINLIGAKYVLFLSISASNKNLILISLFSFLYFEIYHHIGLFFENLNTLVHDKTKKRKVVKRTVKYLFELC